MEAFSCCLDEETRTAMRLSKEIEREIERWKKDSSKEYKLLLLGTGEAGKSTFIKQMRIIHGAGYTDKDRAEFRQLIFQNVLKAVQILTEAMEALKVNYSDASNRDVGLQFTQKDLEELEDFTAEEKTKIRTFWSDSGVQKCFERRREFQISDSAEYYLNALDRLWADDYVPTLQDVLRVRVPTTGIVEYTFQMRRDVIFRMVDVGGQRSERRKWIHCFEGVKAVIFLTAINEYDQVLFEDKNQNRMRESLALFETINSYPWFVDSSSILFLNKLDLFEAKISKSHLGNYFPQFQEAEGDSEAAKNFIASMFLAMNPDPENKRIFHHFTTATDTENIKRVFEDVKTHVLEENLRDYNLM